MARLHSHKHGKSHQTRPTSKRPPTWLTYSPDEVQALILKFAREGQTTSMIGVRLRDEYGIPLVKPIMGKSISDVLKEAKLLPPIPEDLRNLVETAIRVQKHLETFKSDHRNVRSLELIEAKVYRMSKYYKSIGRLPEDFKFKAMVAQLS